MSTSTKIAELEHELARLKKIARCPREAGAGVGGAIQRTRQFQGLSLRQLASKAKVSTGILSKIERAGCPNITLSTLARITNALNLKMSEFFFNAENNV